MTSTLAVKYRPKTFDQIIGQETAVKVIKGLVRDNKILGRGLFISGPTGVGKTTLARLVAHATNCEAFDLEAFRTCGECEYCKQVKKGIYPGLEELNFAETRGIETIRSMINDCAFESMLKAKVVILDEMHNMTPQASEAFLKILEEPPENTIFILLTTAPGKVTSTIKDRCTRLSLNFVKSEQIKIRLEKICQREKVEIPSVALDYLVRRAGGIVRNAVSSLEAVISLVRTDPEANLLEFDILEDSVAVSATSPANIAEYLAAGIYGGSYGKSLALLAKCANTSDFNPSLFMSKVYDFHLQGFYCLIDPARKQKLFFSSQYEDFYATLEALVAHKKGALMVTIESAEKIFDILFEISERLKSHETEPLKLLTVYTIKMVQTVKEFNAAAYTTASPFHAKYAEGLLND